MSFTQGTSMKFYQTTKTQSYLGKREIWAVRLKELFARVKKIKVLFGFRFADAETERVVSHTNPFWEHMQAINHAAVWTFNLMCCRREHLDVPDKSAISGLASLGFHFCLKNWMALDGPLSKSQNLGIEIDGSLVLGCFEMDVGVWEIPLKECPL